MKQRRKEEKEKTKRKDGRRDNYQSKTFCIFKPRKNRNLDEHLPSPSISRRRRACTLAELLHRHICISFSRSTPLSPVPRKMQRGTAGVSRYSADVRVHSGEGRRSGSGAIRRGDRRDRGGSDLFLALVFCISMAFGARSWRPHFIRPREHM